MSVAKIDIDVKMDEALLSKFINTRMAILQALNYTLAYYRISETKKGYHLWFMVKEKLKDRDLAELQFLLGDDQIRAKLNFMREEWGVFGDFNALFSKKKYLKRKRLKYRLVGFLAKIWERLKYG